MKLEEILAKIDELRIQLTDPTTVSVEEMDRLYPVYGNEQAIKMHKKRDNDAILAEIKRLEDSILG